MIRVQMENKHTASVTMSALANNNGLLELVLVLQLMSKTVVALDTVYRTSCQHI
jgi:hypothetical protein